MKCGLVVIGNISKDTISYNEKKRGSSWGGSGLNIAISASQFVDQPKLISVVGNDASDLLSRLKNKIDISLVKVLFGETCLFDIYYSDDGTLQNIDCNFGVATDLNLYFQSIDLPLAHYHVSCRLPLIPDQIFPKIVQTGYPYSLDFIISSAHQQISQSKNWIKFAKYVFVNAQEFEILENLQNISDLETLIVTSASQPIKVLRFGYEILRHSCCAKVFHDVTGAGDVFIGTFLANQINGCDLNTSIDKAIFMAQLSLDSLGVLQFLNRGGVLPGQ